VWFDDDNPVIILQYVFIPFSDVIGDKPFYQIFNDRKDRIIRGGLTDAFWRL
jgi:hypothetical protein